MSAQPSTFASRRLVVDAPQMIPYVYVKGEYPFPVQPIPYYARTAGVYRADLDLVEHTATIIQIAVSS